MTAKKVKSKKEVYLEFTNGSVYVTYIPQSVKVVVEYPNETVELPLVRMHEPACVIRLASDFSNLRVLDLAGARLIIKHEGRKQIWE